MKREKKGIKPKDFSDEEIYVRIEENVRGGDVFVIQPEIRHYFSSEEGIILEEISTTHYLDDSYYTDAMINANTNRKTFLTHWRMV
jgi:N-acetylneuraminate synthase